MSERISKMPEFAKSEMLIGTGAAGRVFVLRLGAEADICRSLEELAVRENVSGAVIVSAIGNIRRASIRNLRFFPPTLPVTDDMRVFVLKEEAMELVGLTGNITRVDGHPYVHVHATISVGAEEGRVIGGHVQVGTLTMSMAEIVVMEIAGVNLERRTDPATGDHELCFE